jgi:hypothetical protein
VAGNRRGPVPARHPLSLSKPTLREGPAGETLRRCPG